MNKKVIALAVAGALALPLAAKAQTANVTMYGTFRLAMESTDLKDVGRNNQIDSWSSRWGIRGIECIGGGLNGIFQLELGVGLDHPGGANLDGTALRNQVVTIREAWAGLNGGFGTVKMGAGLTPCDDVLGYGHLLLANGFEGMTTLGGGVNPAFRVPAVSPTSRRHSVAGRQRQGNIGAPEQPELRRTLQQQRSLRLAELQRPDHRHALCLPGRERDAATSARAGTRKVDLQQRPDHCRPRAMRVTSTSFSMTATPGVGHVAYDFGVVKLDGQYQRMKLRRQQRHGRQRASPLLARRRVRFRSDRAG